MRLSPVHTSRASRSWQKPSRWTAKSGWAKGPLVSRLRSTKWQSHWGATGRLSACCGPSDREELTRLTSAAGFLTQRPNLKSSGFSFLTKRHVLLVRHAARAERYLFDDPSTSLVKIWQFAELLA